MITVRVLLFGHLKDIVAGGATTLTLAEGATTTDAANALAVQDARFAGLLTKARVAVQQEFADADAVLHDEDEIAFLPPMSGG
ncbi:MAG: MoaD/ThiS family protein [Alphaproteobacteria bacterium]|nr:MAG: MoaD/ThiS family protein [Alphaproteobacteria bacterium]